MRAAVALAALGCVIAGFAAAGSPAAAAPPASSVPTGHAGEVLVVGPPAPALWRATRGAGELWILPAPPALPRGLAWSRLRLEGVLAGSRRLITPSEYVLARGGAPGRPALTPLAERLPSSVRERFAAALAAVGASPAAYDRLSPLDAAYRLRDDAEAAAGLDGAEPGRTVRALARRAGAQVVPAADYRVRLDAASPALADRQAAGCLDAAIDDADWARSHAPDAARAWALGDVRAWLAQSQPPSLARCLDAAPAFAALHARNLDDVTRAAIAALAEGGHSVLITTPDLLLRPGGLLDRLHAAGAAVTPPVADR